MCSPPAIRVNDDLAPSQAGVTVGTANHKPTSEGEEVHELAGRTPPAIGSNLTQAVAVTAVHPVFVSMLPQNVTSALLQSFSCQAGGLCKCLARHVCNVRDLG